MMHQHLSNSHIKILIYLYQYFMFLVKGRAVGGYGILFILFQIGKKIING